jgi:hypothetical protein
MNPIQLSLHLCLYLAIIFTCHCTSNPFSKDEIEPTRQTVSGVVELDDDADPGGVFVWLEQLDISTTTDSTGKFTIELPPPQTQPGGGLNGVYRLYCYVANYQFAIYRIAIARGSIVYGEEHVGNSGELKSAVTLKKLFDISSGAFPAAFPHDSTGYIDISIRLYDIKKATKITTFVNRATQTLACVVLKEISAPAEDAMLVQQSIWTDSYLLFADTVLSMHLFSRDASLSPGRYEIYPYLVIEQDNLPPELLKSLGRSHDIWHWHTDYLKIPVRQHIGVLTITE